jgi:hypothetical protein
MDMPAMSGKYQWCLYDESDLVVALLVQTHNLLTVSFIDSVVQVNSSQLSNSFVEYRVLTNIPAPFPLVKDDKRAWRVHKSSRGYYVITMEYTEGGSAPQLPACPKDEYDFKKLTVLSEGKVEFAVSKGGASCKSNAVTAGEAVLHSAAAVLDVYKPFLNFKK